MNRRRFLTGASASAGLTATVSGCLGRLNDLRYRVTDDFSRRVSIADVDSLPDDFPLEYDVSVSEETITAEQYARLEIETTNRSDSTRAAAIPFYKGASSDYGDGGILLYELRAPDRPSTDTGPECSTIGVLEWTQEFIAPTDLAPGESARNEYIVVDDPSVTGCFPVGEYRFEDGFTYGDGTDRTLRWGITIRLTDK